MIVSIVIVCVALLMLWFAVRRVRRGNEEDFARGYKRGKYLLERGMHVEFGEYLDLSMANRGSYEIKGMMAAHGETL